LPDAKTRAVHELRHQRVQAMHAIEDGARLRDREHRGQPSRSLGADDVVEPGELDVEHLPVEKEQRRQRLVLRRGRHLVVVGEGAQEGGDVLAAEIARMALAVEEDETANPVGVSTLGPQAVVVQADVLADGVEEAGGGCAYHTGSYGTSAFTS